MMKSRFTDGQFFEKLEGVEVDSSFLVLLFTNVVPLRFVS